MEDITIIELYHKRDERAIRESNRKYGNDCFRLANRILSSDEDSEECVADTWLHAWNSMPPQRPNSLKLFLLRITRNLSFDRYKARGREKRGGGEMTLVLDEMKEFVADVRDVETEYEQKELMRALHRFLYEQPKREADIFICRYYFAKSTKEIAKKYGLKENHVLVILSRIRKALKKFLEMEGHCI